MAALIAYYSRAGENYFGGTLRRITVGNTEKIARMIAEVTGGALFRIEQRIPYSADYRTCITEAERDLKMDVRPELKALPEDFCKYDEIFLGYPNYWGTMPMAVHTFLDSFDWRGKVIRPFCTHEGSGLGRSCRDIARAAAGAVVGKGLAVSGNMVDDAVGTVKAWCLEK